MGKSQKRRTSIINYLQRLLLSGHGGEAHFADSTKILFIRVIFITSVPLLTPLIIKSVLHESYIHALFNGIFLVSSTISFFLLSRVERLRSAIYLALSGIYSLMLYIVIFGGSEISDIIFIFVVPYITYFLLECRAGGILSILFSLLVAASLAFPFMPVYQRINNPDWSIRMLITYVIINVVSWLVAMAHCRYTSKLEQLAYTDYLTGLPNRRKLDEMLDLLLNEASRNNEPTGIFMLNIDRMQLINDQYAHHVGDKILRQFGQRIRELVPSGVSFGRHASADFMIFGLNDNSITGINTLAEKIHIALKEPFVVDNYQIRISTCIGITMYPLNAKTRTDILKKLDLSLSQAKKLGPETTAFYNEESQKIYLENFRMGEILQDAYLKNEVSLVYQPRINLIENKVKGMEVLARWKNPEFGHVSPTRFIPIAEDIGIIPNLTEWILEKAWEHYRVFEQAGFGGLRMSVNLSPVHIRNANFLDSMHKLIERCGINPALVELEITEGLLLQDDTSVRGVLNTLSEMGFTLSLDDFGTGYSSLSYLKKFHVDCIKIDRSFVLNMKGEDSSAEIVRAIVAMAKSLKLKITAEGVEYREQLDFLRKLECDEVQGFYFSKPVSVEDFLAFMAKPIEP